MLMHRQGVISANRLEDVDASGRRSARKRLRKAAPMFKSQIAVAALIAVTVAGCNKTSPPLAEARPVRTITIEHGAEGEIVSLTGHIRAKDEVSLAFRLDGRMIERPVNVGRCAHRRPGRRPPRPPDSGQCAALGGSQSRVG